MSAYEKLMAWQSTGEFMTYGPSKHRMYVKQVGSSTASADKTLLLLHGFPESSHSYHAVLDGLINLRKTTSTSDKHRDSDQVDGERRFNRIVLFDMLGYGLSDKPDAYSYSLLEQADTALCVWKHFGVTGGHLLSHDMGDSVATELVARHQNETMPGWFSDGLQSLTFTNGSMVMELCALRTVQHLLLSGYGYYLQYLTVRSVMAHQIRSAHGNATLSQEEIDVMWEANLLQEGNMKTYLTIKYINDRKQFETTRWLPALAQTKLPVHLCWGDSDSVARVEMVHHLKQKVCKEATVTIMNGVGHFCQLGSPEKWLEAVGAYYTTLG